MATEYIVTAWGGQSSQKWLGDGWPGHLAQFDAVSPKGANGRTAYNLGDTPRLVAQAGRALYLWHWVYLQSSKAARAEADVIAAQVHRYNAEEVWVNAEHAAVYGLRRKSGPLKGRRRRPREKWETRCLSYLSRLRELVGRGVRIVWNGLSGRAAATKRILAECDAAVAMCYGSIGKQVPKRVKSLRKRMPGKPVGAMIHSGRMKHRRLGIIAGHGAVVGTGPEDYLEATLRRLVLEVKPDMIAFWVGGGSAVSGRIGPRKRCLGRLGYRNHRSGGGPARPGNPSLRDMVRRLRELEEAT